MINLGQEGFFLAAAVCRNSEYEFTFSHMEQNVNRGEGIRSFFSVRIELGFGRGSTVFLGICV